MTASRHCTAWHCTIIIMIQQERKVCAEIWRRPSSLKSYGQYPCIVRAVHNPLCTFTGRTQTAGCVVPLTLHGLACVHPSKLGRGRSAYDAKFAYMRNREERTSPVRSRQTKRNHTMIYLHRLSTNPGSA